MELEKVYNELSICSFFSAFHRLTNSYLSHSLKSYDLGFGQYQFLFTLYLEDGLSQEELTKRIAVDKVTTTRAIERLKQNGYVTVCKNEEDKRFHNVFLTQKAKDIQDEVLSIASKWQDMMLTNLSEDEKDIMLKMCRKIITPKER